MAKDLNAVLIEGIVKNCEAGNVKIQNGDALITVIIPAYDVGKNVYDVGDFIRVNGTINGKGEIIYIMADGVQIMQHADKQQQPAAEPRQLEMF